MWPSTVDPGPSAVRRTSAVLNVVPDYTPYMARFPGLQALPDALDYQARRRIQADRGRFTLLDFRDRILRVCPEPPARSTVRTSRSNTMNLPSRRMLW
jgi:hypothetical protein